MTVEEGGLLSLPRERESARDEVSATQIRATVSFIEISMSVNIRETE